MASLESIHEKLQVALKALDEASNEIVELRQMALKEHLGSVGAAIGRIVMLQREIYRLRPELEPPDDEPREPDGDLTAEQKQRVERLSGEDIKEIDCILLSHATPSWRKVAMLVGLAMTDARSGHQREGLPDVFYSQRIRALVEQGHLESQGNLQYMRFSEVRLPDAKAT